MDILTMLQTRPCRVVTPERALLVQVNAFLISFLLFGDIARREPFLCVSKEKEISLSAITFLIGSFFVTTLLGWVLPLARGHQEHLAKRRRC
jgi:hypothetical protein